MGEVVLPVGVPEPQSLAEVVDDLDQRLREGRLEDYLPIPTGFAPFDEYLGGGLHAEDLWLVGGMQNIGKTVAVLQMARNVARSGRALAMVVCYEHSPLYLLHRLLCLESIDPSRSRPDGGITRDAIDAVVVEGLQRGESVSFEWLVDRVPGAWEVWRRIQRYLEGLWLILGDGRRTTADVLELYVELAQERGYNDIVLFVDYLQIVPVRPSLSGERYDDVERINVVMKALKTIALQYHVPVVGVAAADEDALRRQRVHLENLWGSSLVQYEPDGALIMNRGPVGPALHFDKAQYERQAQDTTRGTALVRWAEKNRRGPSEVEMEMVLHGPYYAFDPVGRPVEAEESYQHERVALRARRECPSTGD